MPERGAIQVLGFFCVTKMLALSESLVNICTGFVCLHSSDAVRDFASNMTYNVFGGTSNLAQSVNASENTSVK